MSVLAAGSRLAFHPSTMIDVGGLVGNYRVLAKLGEGSMGNVFFAQHPVIGRNAAIKVIAPEYARNADMVARFVDEARSLQQIGHENIVEITDFGRTQGDELYLVMEYLEGEPLSRWIARRIGANPQRVDERLVARSLAIAIQIADALVASHAQQIIHRDLKPDNVILVTRGDNKEFVKVLDFGVAKRSHHFSPRDTQPGTIMGTPMYMAPEQCEGRTEVDERADVYSLGVVLFEMLTGQTPFNGETVGDVVIQKTTREAPSADSLVAGLPASLTNVLRRALARDPVGRFASMQAFRQALSSIDLTSDFLGATFAGEVTRLVAPAKRGRVSPGRVGGGKRFRPASLAVVVAAVAASALVAVAFPTTSLRARAEAAMRSLGADDDRQAPAHQPVVSVALSSPPPIVANPEMPTNAPAGEALDTAARQSRSLIPATSSTTGRRSAGASSRERTSVQHLSHDDVIAPSFAAPASGLDDMREVNETRKMREVDEVDEVSHLREVDGDDVLPPSALQ